MAVTNAYAGAGRRGLARAAAARAEIDHPNLLRARLARGEDSRVSVRLETCSAPTLTQVLARRKLSTAEAVKVVQDVATAVQVLSDHGLRARDLNPGRIRIDARRGAILADSGIPFELAPRRLSEARRDVAYRSPEELEEGSVDSRSSVYSLGAILYSSLTGRRPTEFGPGARRPGQRAAIPPRLAVVIERAMARNPADRYADVGDLSIAAFAASRIEMASSATRRREPAEARNLRSSMPPETEWEFPEVKRPGRERRENKAPRVERPKADKPRVDRPKAERPKVDKPKVNRPIVYTAEAPAGPPLRLPRLPTPDLSGVKLPRVDVPGPAVLATVAALVACILAGVMLGRGSGEEAQATEIQSRLLTIPLPSGWAPSEAPRYPALGLTAAVAAAPNGDDRAGIVAGRVPDTLAADRLLREEMGSEGTRTDVQLGPLQAWRYDDLALRPNETATAYLVPTTGAPLLTVCHAPPLLARTVLPECERMAATTVLRGERPLTLEGVDSRGEQLEAALTTLRRDRQAARRRLARAELAGGQADVARGLERIYDRSAQRVEEILTANGSTQFAALPGSLSATADAYAVLAEAAKDADRTRYRNAIEVVREREAAVVRAAAAPE
jgi:Protein kinase domain